MPLSWILLAIFAIAAAGFWFGTSRVLKSVDQNVRALHSLPSYYGGNVSMWVLVPSLGVLVFWSLAQPLFIESRITYLLEERMSNQGVTLGLMMTEVRRIADGLNSAVTENVMTTEEARSMRVELTDIRNRLAEVGVALGANVTAPIVHAAQQYRQLSATGNMFKSITVIALALAGLGYALLRTTKDFRARNAVERGILAILLFAAMIAIMTTVGILFSLIFNTLEFFKIYPIANFFFGLEWAPSFSGRGGSSSLSVIPLLWGTFYISIIALIVAVPVGIFSAIYLSEYATPKVRAFAKPLLEILAGIPTIVYGLFALLTVGPMLVTVFGDHTVGWMSGGTAVITAGLVMGIMLIPFVSSLSDDIINAVPQSLRDGSYGLGATQSETIRQVILPAALPGIVGAILLAASRAIGETMIVVLGAGAAARLSLNPFDAMTTVTAKIVSQLTGDSDFASPEALVAFALGTTLFVLTLALNVLALYIVRRYREQYE